MDMKYRYSEPPRYKPTHCDPFDALVSGVKTPADGAAALLAAVVRRAIADAGDDDGARVWLGEFLDDFERYIN